MNIAHQLARHPGTRWAVPVVVASVALGGTALVSQVSANAASELPARSAAQLLVDVQQAADTSGSGTVVQKADLGLPQLPTMGGAGSSDLTSLISGNHTLRVWYDGGTKARVALMGTLGESDVIRNGRDLWTWSSDSNSATHRVLPAESAKQTPSDLNTVVGLTPQQVAEKALAAIDPTTSVRTDGAARVAGRSAYELVLAPKDTSSLIGQVRIAVDAVKRVPLRVQVFAKNANAAAIEVGFTQISFNTPSDTQFRFNPPPGAKVTEQTDLGPGHRPDAADQNSTSQPAPGDALKPTVSGTGWTTVVQAQLPTGIDELSSENGSSGGPGAAARSLAQLTDVLDALPRKSGSWGSGRLLTSPLFNVLLTDNGRVLAGAVSADRLYALAGQPLPNTPATTR